MIRTGILLLLCFLTASAGLAQTEAIDLTAVFRAGGIEVDKLLVYKVSDIVLIRGRTSNIVMAAQAGRFAKSLGYQRVANLIEIVPALADDAIELHGARELDMARELEGCSFQIQSIAGVIRLRGHIVQELQGDFAIAILLRIDGVSVVHSELISTKAP
ncbi:MAG TPA: BON domain-containing protein [Thermoanaerobaculia bacterium]|jgi:hypothetical protein